MVATIVVSAWSEIFLAKIPDKPIGYRQCDSFKIDAKTSSNQNSILKKGVCRTFLFQTENLFFNIDFQYQELQKLGLKITDKNESRFLELPTHEVDIEK